jgi:nitrite reductase/ring-hydroxylating ferredoxin subunit
MTKQEEEASGYVRVALTSEIPEGTMKTFELEDGKMVLITNLNGSYYAIGAICTHEEWDLSEGTLTEEGRVECAGHGAIFDVKSGNVISGPGGTDPDTIQAEPPYEVKVEGNNIFVKVR